MRFLHVALVSVGKKAWRHFEGRASIQLFLCVLVASSVWGQATPSTPVVRDAFVLANQTPVRDARLTDRVEVVVCKTDYDSWAQGQRTGPLLSLYLGGSRVTKGARPTVFALAEDTQNDPSVSAVRQKCADTNPAVGALDRTAQDSEAEAKDSVSKAATGRDPKIIDELRKDAAEKTTAARSAREQADAAWEAASEIEVLDYYVDPALVVNPDTRDSWLQLLRRPWYDAPVAISVGPEGGPWPSEATISLKRLNIGWLAAWTVLFVAAVVLFVRYARNSDIIRDAGTLPAGAPSGSKKAYSLARTQMAIWTFLVAAALVFIFMVTWNENVITSGVLVLIGISFGTTLLAAVADGTEPVPQPSENFFTDLLSDGAGPSFHRYQMVLFTAILAVIFIVKVATNLVMPDFDTTLLGLMGISNGTYLGFKLQGR